LNEELIHRMSEKVGDLANQAFVSLDENALVAEAAKALYEREECSVIVTGNDPASQARIPVGIITERDIIFRVVAQNRGPFKVKLRDIMSRPLITILDEMSTSKALSMMKRRNVTRLPVVDKKGRLVGMITMQGLVRSLPTTKDMRTA
jgi:CBS domain-containing protein